MFPSGTKKASKPANKSNAPRKPVIDEKMCSKTVRKPREIVTAYDATGLRPLAVPDRNPIDTSAIFSSTEFQRLVNQAHIVTLKDRMAMLDEAEKKKSKLQEESEARKAALSKMQVFQKPKIGSKLGDEERQAKAKNLYLLERSFELMQEQDNRVKCANGVILATKCRAIRNAQIAEKELLEKQLQEEERRLDMMMEQQRQKEVQKEERRKEEEVLKKQKYIKTLSEQMRINEINRMIEAERIEEESKMINKAYLAMQREEEEKLREKRELQQKIRDDVKRSNAELERYRLIQKEEERIADLRIQKFMKEKMDREIAREQEMMLLKAAKEQEIARMKDAQQRTGDLKAALDEMNALRAQEEMEKKWREQEMQAAKAKKEKQDALRKEREEQVLQLRRKAAITLARDEEEFKKVAQAQKELWEKELEKKKKRKEEADQHRKDLLKQINEKEKERIQMQKEKFEEGRILRFEQAKKDRYVEEYLKKKVGDLRTKNIPDQYISDIEHHIEHIIKYQ